jgi:hypothetical protein
MADQLPHIAPLPGVRRKTFTLLFADPTRDPFQDSYQRIMARLDPAVNPALSYIMLLEQALGSGPVPQAYLCCALRQQQLRVYCLHSPSKFTSSSLDGDVAILYAKS